MHSQSLDSRRHEHVFLGDDHAHNERRTWLVVGLTAATMVVEIVAGHLYGSMALLADGWHMSTHAGALAIAAFAYRYARRHADDRRFAFGTGKLGDLAGFASAVALALVSILIGFESLQRLVDPVAIAFDEAIAVAVIGLAVNVLCAWLLRRVPHHDHHDHDDAAHDHHHHDYNLRGAYLHVLADALTSVLAIAGLVIGRLYGWVWLDAMIGIVGAAVIALVMEADARRRRGPARCRAAASIDRRYAPAPGGGRRPRRRSACLARRPRPQRRDRRHCRGQPASAGSLQAAPQRPAASLACDGRDPRLRERLTAPRSIAGHKIQFARGGCRRLRSA